jgi:hypothetical protein
MGGFMCYKYGTDEGSIRDVIHEYLVRKGHKPCRIWQTTRKPKRDYYPEARGVSDIIGCTKDGRFFAIEVKKPGGVVSPQQSKYLDEIRAKGGVALVATDLETVIAAGL